MRPPCCLRVCESPSVNFSMLEPMFMELRMYIMAPELISMAYFINPSHLCVYTGCPRRNVPDFGRVFLMLKYTDVTRNTMSKVERLRR
jgi:hypothetical protein